MREIKMMSPKRSEILMEQKRENRIVAREEKREERNLAKKDNIHLKNKRIVEKKKKEMKSSMKLQAEALRRQAAHGEITSQRNEDPRDDFYLQNTPLHVCNICSRILDSKNGKERHVKDTASHHVYDLPCTSKDKCGALFLNKFDLSTHKDITGH